MKTGNTGNWTSQVTGTAVHRYYEYDEHLDPAPAGRTTETCREAEVFYAGFVYALRHWLGRNHLESSSLDRPDRYLPVVSYIDIVPLAKTAWPETTFDSSSRTETCVVANDFY